MNDTEQRLVELRAKGAFVVRLICCGRDEGSWPPPSNPFKTWEEADAFRGDYINAEGHERVGIIVAAPPAPGAPEREGGEKK